MSAAEQSRLLLGLRKWVEYAVDGLVPRVTVVFSQLGAPRPARPYADITVDSDVEVGRAERRAIDAAGNREVVAPHVATVTVALYGPSAMGLANQVRKSLELEAVTLRLRGEGVSFLQADGVQNASVALETGFEERGIFTAQFSYRASLTEFVGWAEAAEILATLVTSPLEDDFQDYSATLWVPESPP